MATYTALAALAVIVRLLPLLLGNGLRSYGRYDDGVYYTAADMLTFGRVPYRDFILLHPPGITLVLAPFALLGRVTSDPIGMMTGRIAFILVGGANTVLVAMLASRWSRRAAIAAGVLYAAWYPAVYAEQSTMLEPLGTTALLVVLLLLLKRSRPLSLRTELVAGAVLGFSMTLKIWYVATWAFVIGWQIIARGPRAAVRVAAASLAVLSAVLLPFVILARGRFFDMVVRDQLLRRQAATDRVTRLSSIFNVRPLLVGNHALAVTLTVVAALVLIASAVQCWMQPDGRVLVGVLGVTLAVLMLAPSYFPHYGALTAAPAALVFGVGLGGIRGGWLAIRPQQVLAAVVVLGLAAAVRLATVPEGKSFPGDLLARSAPPGCVVSDDPSAVIQMNRLSSDLAAGCPLAADVSGITYDSLRLRKPNGKPVRRAHNVGWQHWLYAYLISGRSFVVARHVDDELSPTISRDLQELPIVAVAGHFVLRQGIGFPAQPPAVGITRSTG